jgi:sirohydrochlorin cobaltochelatase
MPNGVQPPVRLPETEAFTFGQVLIRPLGDGRFVLSHRDDADATQGLQKFSDPDDALEISRIDDAGHYRPLKTAPNLRRGWQLELADSGQLKLALDHFYPGRFAIIVARAKDRLYITSLRDTLGRQTGMYRIAANISDEQLDELVGDFCRSDGGCLRTILWKRDGQGTVASTRLPPEKFDPAYDQALASGASPAISVHVPLLCQEACNLLVAECRKVVKSSAKHS